MNPDHIEAMENQTNLQTGLSSSYVRQHRPPKHAAFAGDAEIAWGVLVNQIRSIFFVLLLVSAVLSFYLGNHTDAWIFIVLNAINVILGFMQEFKASKASKTLENMVRHTVTVIRDGQSVSVESEDVIKGDVVLLAPGNVLVADMVARQSLDAFIDESVRTGESAPRSINDGDSLYAGTNVVGGTIVAEVVAAGEESSLMQYGKTLKLVRKDNNFARFVRKVSIYILLITLSCLALIAVVAVAIEHKYTSTSFLLFAIAMLIGVVPESLSLIITLMLTREALSLSREGVIVKNLSALQQLGSIRYLLTDKTGTLTENAIRLVAVHDEKNLRESISRIAVADYERTPMDAAFDNALLDKVTSEISGDTPITSLVRRKPAVATFSNKTGYAAFDFDDVIIRRGQFESVLKSSTGVSESAAANLLNLYEEYESKGLRVLAFASSLILRDPMGERVSAEKQLFTFNGFAVFEDPLKSDASHSYLATEGLGIHVKILTGDSVLVSKYVAHQLDRHFDEKNVEELGTHAVAEYSAEEIERDRVYARCLPEQKLDLIDRHIPHGAVGFMGEGINDALALKRADVGIAVTNASDVARQSADILLTEKSLNPVIRAIQLSRRAYAHISTYLICTLTGNIGTLISLTLVALFWKNLPMLPIQILLNNLLTDVPLILLVTDHLSKSEYSKPIDHSAKDFFKTVFVYGFISSIFDMIYFYIYKDNSVEVLRTGWFIFSVMAELVLVFSLRTKLSMFKAPRLSKTLGIALLLSGLAALVFVYLPFLNSEFSLVPLAGHQIGVIALLLVIYVMANEGYKSITRKKTS
jgi:Mg2+-importing ATPase